MLSHSERGDALSITDYFEVVLPVMLKWKGDAATNIGRRCRYIITNNGKELKRYTIKLEPPEADVLIGDCGHVDITIKIEKVAMEDILAGEFDARQAMADGEYELSGDLKLLKKIASSTRLPYTG